MKRILVVADRESRSDAALSRAVALARGGAAQVTLLGFMHEDLGNLPTIRAAQAQRIKAALLHGRAQQLRQLAVRHDPAVKIETVWEKHVAEWVNDAARRRGVDLVIKTGHRSENWHYTPTDWLLLRGCPAPVLIVPERSWRRRGCVLAAVDLGTGIASKRALNLKLAQTARTLADQLGQDLQLAYAVPFSHPLRDLGVLDTKALLAEARVRADVFRRQLADTGIAVDAVHVKTGPPEKVLASLAAKSGAQVVVLGCIGRKALAGRLIGNTAERILRYVKADVLAVKP